MTGHTHQTQTTPNTTRRERADGPMLRARATGGVGRICGWIGAPGVAGAAGLLPLGLTPATTAAAAASTTIARRIGSSSSSHQQQQSPVVMPALLLHPLSGMDQGKPAAGPARWGWRRAAAVSSLSSSISPSPLVARRPFGTSARSPIEGSRVGGSGSGSGSGADGAGPLKAAKADGHEQHPHQEQQDDEPKVGKIRMLVRRYGPVAVVTYLGVYVTTLGLLFGAIEAGVNPFDYGVDSGGMVEKVTGMLDGYSWGEPVVEAIRKNPHVGNFALAWILTKFTEPLRMLLTIGIVPKISRALGRVPPVHQQPR